MPRPKTNLDAWRGTIEQRITEGQTQPEILAWLNREGIVVSRSTFKRILQAWGAQTNYARLRIHLQDPSLPAAVHELWSQHQLNDAQIAETLTARGTALLALQV